MLYITNNSIFGENLKYIRESSGFTPEYMAKLLNIPEDKLNLLENGQCMEADGLIVRILLDLVDENVDLFEKNIHNPFKTCGEKSEIKP